jgi:putative ATP-dependent endonuclease of the OLD family
MILKNVIIQNYRKFLDVSFALDNDITLLAGANNSGKTSLIDLLQGIVDNENSYSVTGVRLRTE